MDLFPYPPRPFQEVAVALVEDAAEEGNQLVLEMPTGSGKTVILLAGALAAAQRLKKRVLYLTRTNSQQAQAVREFNAIRDKSGLQLRAVALQGRGRLCLKLEETQDPDWQEASPEELSHYCSAAKSATDRNPSGARACRFWAGLQALNAQDLRNAFGPRAQTAEAVKKESSTRGICPFEATKRLLLDADLVIAPYLFGLEPNLAKRLLFWWGVNPSDVILLVDEAHNLPEFLRGLGTPRLGRETLKRALLESQELNHPDVLPRIPSKHFLGAMSLALEDVVKQYCIDDDGFLPPFEFEGRLLERFTTTTRALANAATALIQMGEMIKDRRRLLGKIPRSHLSKVGAFLASWLDTDQEGYVKLVGKGHLEAFLVDSARAAEPIHQYHASIHVSGTLDPLQEYKDALGLAPDTRLERFPSPFPAENLRVRVVEGVTTRYESAQDPAAVDALQDATRQTVGAMRVNGACFFASHRTMEEFREVGVFGEAGPSPLFERRDLGQEGLMHLVAQHRNAPSSSLLVGVLGGRISEGLDFPGKELEALAIVGVPYPKPSAHQRALFHYFETRFGRGWEYAARAPALRRLRQAIGRLIRSETDRGFAIVLDERATLLLRSGGVDAEPAPLENVLREFMRWQAEPGLDAPPPA